MSQAQSPTTDEIPTQGRGDGSINIIETLSSAWELFAAELIPYVLAGIILIVLSTVTLGILTPALTIGFIGLIKRQMNGEELAASKIFDGFSAFGSSIIAGLLIAIPVCVGLMFFVLPGVVLAILWCFTFHFIAFEEQGATEAMGSAWRLAKENIGSTLLLLLVAVFLSIVGTSLVIGSLLTTPLALITVTVGFRELRS